MVGRQGFNSHRVADKVAQRSDVAGMRGSHAVGGSWARMLWRGGYAELVCRVDIAAH